MNVFKHYHWIFFPTVKGNQWTTKSLGSHWPDSPPIRTLLRLIRVSQNFPEHGPTWTRFGQRERPRHWPGRPSLRHKDDGQSRGEIMHCIAIIRAERGRSNHAICFWNDHLSPCAELSHCSPGPFSSLFAAICRWHAVRWALIRTHCLVISCRACLPRRGGHGTSQRVTGSRLGKFPRFFIYLLLYTYLSIYFFG